MTQMMESLEARQMFSVTLADPTLDPAASAVDASTPATDVAMACANGQHYKAVTISMRKAGGGTTSGTF